MQLSERFELHQRCVVPVGSGVKAANLPPRGGDARQGRGGREGSRHSFSYAPSGDNIDGRTSQKELREAGGTAPLSGLPAISPTRREIGSRQAALYFPDMLSAKPCACLSNPAKAGSPGRRWAMQVR